MKQEKTISNQPVCKLFVTEVTFHMAKTKSVTEASSIKRICAIFFSNFDFFQQILNAHLIVITEANVRRTRSGPKIPAAGLFGGRLYLYLGRFHSKHICFKHF